MKLAILIIGFLGLGLTKAVSDPAAAGKPFGPYYCQARCLASCLESNVAQTIDECTKFCPPFDDNTPCAQEDIECWQTCGAPIFDGQTPPESVAFVPANLKDDLNDDSYKIMLAWTPSPNASVYIVEFYPLNRQPRSGEPNFFRAMTTSPFYAVRKEDKCIVYDARVISVNAFGISVPSTIFIDLPSDCDNSSFPPVPSPVQPPAPLPLVVAAPISAPGFLPSDISPTQNITDADLDNIPTPPPLPFFVDGSAPMMAMPPGASVSVIDTQNGSDVQIVQVNEQLPPVCDQDMFDTQPSPNPASSSLIDLTITWLEHQPLPPLPTPLYFTVRYGPIVRYLVDDGNQDYSIMPGYETIVRTGNQQTPGIPDPTRHIDIPGLQRNSLMKIQICAIYDPNSEPMIMWDTIPERRIDLAALEPFLDQESPLDGPMDGPMAPDMPDPSNVVPPISQTDPSDDDSVVVPLIIAVDTGSDQSVPPTFYWLFVFAGVLITLSTATMVFVCLRRTCKSGAARRCEKVQNEKVVYYVNAQPPPPSFSEAVKVPPV